jgi:hypothetical protein
MEGHHQLISLVELLPLQVVVEEVLDLVLLPLVDLVEEEIIIVLDLMEQETLLQFHPHKEMMAHEVLQLQSHLVVAVVPVLLVELVEMVLVVLVVLECRFQQYLEIPQLLLILVLSGISQVAAVVLSAQLLVERVELVDQVVVEMLTSQIMETVLLV